MARTVRASLVLSIFAVALVSSQADARGRRPTPIAASIAEASPTLAPFQHVRFCMRYPDDCKSNATDSEVIEPSADILGLLGRVNEDVNAAIIPMLKSYGSNLADEWTIAPLEGDCNDYAVTKRHELIASGLPAKALRLAVVKTESGIGHLVLVVTTTKGDLVLDNLTETIRPWQNTNYHWLKIQSASDARFWYKIGSPAAIASQSDKAIRLADR